MNSARSTFTISLLSLCLIAIGCATDEPSDVEPPRLSVEQQIIENLTSTQGKELLDRTHIRFNFRDKHFEVWRLDGMYNYSRTFTDSSGAVIEMIDNDGVYRYENGELIEQVEKRRNSIQTDVNSVVYFALLPYQLGDAAVIPTYHGEDVIDGVAYKMLEVNFKVEGGGRDYQDRFMYWVHPEDNVIDYLAYYYLTDGGGARFRKATNRRRVGGILFADYLNYRAEPDTVGSRVELFGQLFNSGAIEQVSEIVLDSVRVEQPDSIPTLR